MDDFDPIVVDALEKGFTRNKAIGKAQLLACKDIA
jgi:hypothetical protein